MSIPHYNIGKFEITGGTLAPMAGYTDIAFRTLCKDCGAGLTVTEMVSVRGLVHGNGATELLMRRSPSEKPSCIQLFGNDPSDFVKAAQIIDCDIIDINMGCPMPKIVKNGDGAALLKTPSLAAKIVAAVVSATDKPVTVKTRLGYEIGDRAAAELARVVEQAGAAAIAIHGRYAEARYAGKADFELAAKIKANASVPIIINGDLRSVQVVPPFDGVMIGRAALENPKVFRCENCDSFHIARRHISLLSQYFDERYTINQARKFFVHYFKGVRGGKALRDNVNRANSVADVLGALDKAQNDDYN